MLPSHCEHTSVTKDELLWGYIKPRKTYYGEILKDFSSGWKDFCTLAGNQCFLILIRPVATSAIDMPTPGKTSFKVPIIAAVLLLRNFGIACWCGSLGHPCDRSIRIFHDGRVPMFRFVADSLNYISFEKMTSVYKVLLWDSDSVSPKSFDISSICTCQSPCRLTLSCVFWQNTSGATGKSLYILEVLRR